MNKLSIIVTLSFIGMICYSCQQETYVQGKRIYEVNCSNCHMADGQGLGEMYPNITQSSYFSSNKDQLACLIRYGKQGNQLSNVVMPANDKLTEVGMNNLINYLLHEWGDQSLSNLNEVKEQLENCEQAE